MSRKQRSLIRPLAACAALMLAGSGAALADGSSMARFGGESYAYFNQMPSSAPASPAWRHSHPNGLTDHELQALSASDLSAFALPSQPPVFARVAADPTWRKSHPNGLTDRELQALSSSSLAQWSTASEPRTTVTATDASPVGGLLRAGSDTRSNTYE